MPNPSKLRVDLRFFAELVAVGVFVQKEGLGVLANQLTLIINNDREDHANLSIIVSFCRHCGDDYAGILPRKYRLLEEKYGLSVPTSQVGGEIIPAMALFSPPTLFSFVMASYQQC